MAEGYLRYYAGSKAEIYSAGIEAHGVNPRAIEVMKEDGVDISYHTSNNVNDYAGMDFDYVITVCDNAKENCPYFSSKVKTIHHNFPDPAKALGTEAEIMNQFRKVRNQIKEFSKSFAESTFSNS